jgi:hypothetical protein
MAEGKTRLVGAIYDLKSGRVRFLDCSEPMMASLEGGRR